MIRAVMFDIGDTLITSLDTEKMFQLILKEKGIKKELAEIKKAHKKATAEFLKKHGDMRPPDAKDFNKIYASWNDLIMKELGLKQKGLGAYVNKRWFDVAGLKVFDDSAPVLRRLTGMGLRLGLVTNGYREEINDILAILNKKKNSGLEKEMFSVIVGRDTAGAAKPDPRPFIHAAGSLGLKPDEVLFVGDRYDKDYVGAQGAGMVPVLLLRGKPVPAGTPKNINTAETLDEIIKFIL
jgi:putative hydrolase of the HAD superfamily